jgi:transposase-like protein
MKRQDNNKMRSLYAQWLASGQSISSFARAHGYSVSSFNYWVKKFQTENSVALKKEGGFSKIAFDIPVGTSQVLTVITYPCGIKIELHSPVSTSYLKELALQC